MKLKALVASSTALIAVALLAVPPASAQSSQKPNIVLIVSDDFGWGDSGVYGGGV